MMGDITVTLDQIYQLTWDLCHMNKIGVKIIFNSINEQGGKHRTIIENKRGIYEIIDKIYSKQVVAPIHYVTDTGTMKVEVLFTYDLANMDDHYIIGFANTSPSNQGTHIDGVLDGIVKYFRDYMNKIYLAGNKKLQVTAQDIRTGLRAVVSVFHLRALYTGQSKSTFSVEEAKPFVSKVTIDALGEWASKNPNDLQKICKYLRDVCEIRMKSDGEKIKMSDKYTASVISGMPAKYKKPNGKGPFEFWIVEGDSCASAMENNRDKSCQAIMPIRGKCLNAFTTKTKKYFENEEIASIFKVCGYNGYSKRFDPDQFRPEKVVIATDADADGSHIQCLLFGLFLRYLPFVITSGKLYVATPPLYGVNLGKNKMKFFSNNIEYIQYVQNVFCKENAIADPKKREYTKRETTKILYENMDYVKDITHVSNVFAIEPYLLEFILYNRGLEYAKFKKNIEKQYPYVTVTKESGTILIRGLVESKYQTIFLNQRLISACKPIIDMIDKSDKFYYVNKSKVTLYGLMHHFGTFEPDNITRYKGLGEMPPKMLGESTVLPGMGRSLQQYTIDDVKAELKFMTSLQSDKSVFSKGIKIRKEDII
jgi:DNA gyrase/topoisomerase IV subunit B